MKTLLKAAFVMTLAVLLGGAATTSSFAQDTGTGGGQDTGSKGGQEGGSRGEGGSGGQDAGGSGN